MTEDDATECDHPDGEHDDAGQSARSEESPQASRAQYRFAEDPETGERHLEQRGENGDWEPVPGDPRLRDPRFKEIGDLGYEELERILEDPSDSRHDLATEYSQIVSERLRESLAPMWQSLSGRFADMQRDLAGSLNFPSSKAWQDLVPKPKLPDTSGIGGMASSSAWEAETDWADDLRSLPMARTIPTAEPLTLKPSPLVRLAEEQAEGQRQVLAAMTGMASQMAAVLAVSEEQVKAMRRQADAAEEHTRIASEGERRAAAEADYQRKNAKLSLGVAIAAVALTVIVGIAQIVIGVVQIVGTSSLAP